MSEAAMPRILIINYHLPPDGSVGGMRWAAFAKYLARSGWEVHVLTSARQPDPSLHPGVHVHVIERARTLNDAYNATARWLRERKSADPGRDGSSASTLDQSPTAKGAGRMRAEVASWLVFPDYSRGWMLRASSAARAIIGKYRIQLVVSSGPPHTAHLAAALATRRLAVPHVIDMRDPWISFTAQSEQTALSSSALKRFVLPRIERRALSGATAVITNSKDYGEVLTRHYPKQSITWIPNGVDQERLPEQATDVFPGLAVAYVGTLYFGRDIGPVLRAFKLFLDRNPAAMRDGSKVRIAGHMDEPHAARFRAQLRALDIDGSVELLGVVSPGAALEVLNRSTVSVVLAQGQGLQVPAKIYESAGMNMPTMVVTEPDSASAGEARRIGAWACEAEDIEAMCGFFEDLWSGRRPRRSSPLDPIDYRHLASTLGTLLLKQIESQSTT